MLQEPRDRRELTIQEQKLRFSSEVCSLVLFETLRLREVLTYNVLRHARKSRKRLEVENEILVRLRRSNVDLRSLPLRILAHRS